MGGFSASRPQPTITGINVTPLVDITLVLLIVFMVTAKLIVSNTALPVDLPKAASGSEIQEILSVLLADGGATQVNGKTLANDDDILPLTRDTRQSNRDVRAVIKADGSVPHRRVMHVLDLLRQAGISKVAFGVTPDAPAVVAPRR